VPLKSPQKNLVPIRGLFEEMAQLKLNF
jgi:hypothetical protein